MKTKKFLVSAAAVIVILALIFALKSVISNKDDVCETTASAMNSVQTQEQEISADNSFELSVHSITNIFTPHIPSTAAPTVATTVAETEAPRLPDDFSCFDDCAFIGNSRIIGFKNYALVKNVYSVVGLNVDTIFTSSVAGSSIPVIDELNGKDYKKVYIMLGDNECGWGDKEVFINKYAKVIDAVKERVPDAEIYIQSVLPVSNHASETNKFGCTNENITAINELLVTLASEKGVHFTNPASVLKGNDGALPDDYASDGIHLNKSTCKVWLEYLIKDTF